MTVTPAAPPPLAESALDAVFLEAALWRAHRQLAGHWLHGLRGSLNAVSLNLALLGRTGRDDEAGPARTLRAQVRELDAALTRFFDRSAIDDEQVDGGLAAVFDSVRALIEPLRHKRQLVLDVTLPPGHQPLAAATAMLHDVLLVLAMQAIDRLPPGGRLAAGVHLEAAPFIVLQLTVDPCRAPDAAEQELLDTLDRILRRSGATMQRQRSGEAETFSLRLSTLPPAVA